MYVFFMSRRNFTESPFKKKVIACQKWRCGGAEIIGTCFCFFFFPVWGLEPSSEIYSRQISHVTQASLNLQNPEVNLSGENLPFHSLWTPAMAKGHKANWNARTSSLQGNWSWDCFGYWNLGFSSPLWNYTYIPSDAWSLSPLFLILYPK